MKFVNPAVLVYRTIFVIALSSGGLLHAQENQSTAVRYSHPILDKINTLVESRQYKKAIDLSLSGAQNMKKERQREGYISLMLRAAEIETFEVWKAKGFPEITITEDYRRPLRYLNEMYSVAGEYISAYPSLQANALFTQAVVYYWLNMPDTAERMHLTALQERRRIYGSESREVADSYLWLAQLYNWGLQRKELAERYYLLAVPLQKKFLPDSRYALGSAYYGLATIARKNFQFDAVETMADLYLSLYVDLPYEQAFAYQLIANMYSNQANFEQSLGMRRKSLEIYEASGFMEDLINGYCNLSSDLRGLGRFQESKNVLNRGLSIWERSEIMDPFYGKALYENLGAVYRLMEEYDSAEFYFDKALKTALDMYGVTNEEVADVYDLRGHLFMDKNNFRKALDDFQRMLTSVIPDFHPDDSYTIPAIGEENPYFMTIIGAHFSKGDALAGWYHQDGDLGHLERAMDNYRAAYRHLLLARQTIADDLSKPFLMSNFGESIEKSIQCAGILYRTSNDETYFRDILHFMELTKYLNVLEALRRAERANNSGISKSLLFELEEVRNDLSRKQRAKLTATALPPDSLRRINEEMVTLIDRRRHLMARISRDAGNSHAGLDSLLVDLDDIRSQLGQDEQLLEYFWGEDSIYVLSITKSAARISSVDHSAAVDSLIATVYRQISGTASFDRDHVDRYGAGAAGIYRELFGPFIEKRRLIIIPDGSLSLIPAEALVTDYQSGKTLSYNQLNYLIYDHEISYAYSSSILLRNKLRDRKSIDGVLAFSYSGVTGNNMVKRSNQQTELPGTYLELETLSRLFRNVTRFTNDKASKDNFVNNTSGHDLIHLGVHGVGDEEAVDNSRLLFKGDSMTDSELYAYEIYNLKLDAGLVVLSACETGIGRSQAGEGVFSIARAFTYAGCPSVVMSLWEVPDRFTAEVMTRFYENLHQEQSVSASLRNAKLQFLKESDIFSAHPANWAAFVVNGQDLAFENNAVGAVWVYALAGVLVLLLLMIGLRYLRNH